VRELGVDCQFVAGQDANGFRDAITARTRLVLAETIGNPGLGVLDIEGVARAAHGAGIPLVVDNTFATPYLRQPLQHGADIVFHSATQWIDGHGTSIGGMVIDGGRFRWDNGRVPRLDDPDRAYHDLSFTREFGTLAFSAKLRSRTLRDTGAALTPFNAFLFVLGLETLPLPMDRISRSARLLAERLAAHP
jgi:O-acetylhomoserine (thiol)-lyase